MSTNAVPGHGASLAVELDPVGSQGTFTVVGELADVKPPTLMRTATETTIHNENIDSQITGVLRRDPMTFTINFIHDNTTHDHTAGIMKLLIDNTVAGWRYRGPGGTAGDDEWIMSGQIESFDRTVPAREGVQTADVSVRLSGPMIIDAVTIGA